MNLKVLTNSFEDKKELWSAAKSTLIFHINAGNCYALVPKVLIQSVLKMQPVGGSVGRNEK